MQTMIPDELDHAYLTRSCSWYTTVVLGVPPWKRDCERTACRYGAMHASRGWALVVHNRTVSLHKGAADTPVALQTVMLVGVGIDLYFPPPVPRSTQGSILESMKPLRLTRRASQCSLLPPSRLSLLLYTYCVLWVNGCPKRCVCVCVCVERETLRGLWSGNLKQSTGRKLCTCLGYSTGPAIENRSLCRY